MSFLDDESSVEDNRFREGIEIIYQNVTYRLTTADQDEVIDGHTYKAFTSQRGESAVSTSVTSTQLIVVCPVATPAVQRYIRGCMPPQQLVLVNVYRKQLVSGVTELIWSGKLTSVSLENFTAKLLIPASSGESMDRRLPTVTVSRKCANVLYDDVCQVDKTSFTVTTTVALHDGTTITAASLGKPSQWAQFGELYHARSGDRAFITSQVGEVIVIHLPIWDVQDGDVIAVSAGCAHDPITCFEKFANADNYFGAPDLPSANPCIPNGFGVIAQT